MSFLGEDPFDMTCAPENIKEARLLAIITRGEKVSDPAVLPTEFRNLLVKTLLINFNCEWWGGFNYARALFLAPDHVARKKLEIIAAEEMGHAYYLAVGPLKAFGIDPYAQLTRDVKTQRDILKIFQFPEVLCRSWADVLIFNRLQDATADMQLDERKECCVFQPDVDAICRIESEEKGHVEHGEYAIRELITQPNGKNQLQVAFNFWLPLALSVFGGVGRTSKSFALYKKWGLKKHTNDESRELFKESIRPFFTEIDLTSALLDQ